MGPDAAHVRRRDTTGPTRSGCCSRTAPMPARTRANVNLSEEAARDQAAQKKRNEVLISFMPQERARLGRRRAEGAPPRRRPRIAALAGSWRWRRGGGGGRMQPRGSRSRRRRCRPAIDSGRAVMNAAGAAKGPVTEVVDTINGGVAGYADVGRRRGRPDGAAPRRAPGEPRTRRRRCSTAAPTSTTPSLGDHTTPLLIAAINGQFDVAMLLIERGADPNLASNAARRRSTPTINTAVGAADALPAAAGDAEPEGDVPRRDEGAAQGAARTRTRASRRIRGTSRSTTAATPTAASRTSTARRRSGARRTRPTSTR